MRYQVFANTAGKPLAEKICKLLSIPLGAATVDRFKDGEVNVRILENVRDNDVYIVAPTQVPYSNLIEAQHLCDAARMSSAKRVTYVIPYLGGARGDRKNESRMPIPVRLMLKTLEVAMPDRFMLFDVHAEQSLPIIENAVWDHLYGAYVLVRYLRPILNGTRFEVAAPDQGGGSRAGKYAELFGLNDFVSITKLRTAPGEIKEKSIKIGAPVKGKTILIVDDMIDSGGTIIKDAEALKKAGAQAVWVAATHGVFSSGAIEKIEQSPIDRVFVTDSFMHPPEDIARSKKIEVVSCAELFAQAIRRTNQGESLSELILT